MHPPTLFSVILEARSSKEDGGDRRKKQRKSACVNRGASTRRSFNARTRLYLGHASNTLARESLVAVE